MNPIRPSSLPKLELSPCFVPDSEGNEYTAAGTARHKAMAAALLCGHDEDLDTIEDEEEREGVAWATRYIRDNRTLGEPVAIEQRLTLLDDEFQPILTGTPDAVCGPDVFDLKWRYADYDAQMMAYALAVMERADLQHVTVHVLYGQSQYAKKFLVTWDAAKARVDGILNRVRGRGPNDYTPSDACGFCAHRLSCPALLAMAKAVVAGYAETERIREWHPSKIVSGEEFAAALEVAGVVKDWIESVGYHAKQFVERGQTIPGYELRTKVGKAFITSAEAAFPLCRLDQDQFLKACDVRLNTSKKYPDKQGIINIYATVHGLKVAPAKREVTKLLTEGGVLVRGGSSQSLAKIKTSNQEEEENGNVSEP